MVEITTAIALCVLSFVSGALYMAASVWRGVGRLKESPGAPSGGKATSGGAP